MVVGVNIQVLTCCDFKIFSITLYILMNKHFEFTFVLFIFPNRTMLPAGNIDFIT